MKLLPLGKRVVVEREEITTTKSGLIIPDSAKEKPATGKVIAISDDKAVKEVLKAGDVVLFGKYSGTEIADPTSDNNLLILELDDIFCKIN